MTILPNTLAARLFILTTITALIGVLIVAFIITEDYRKSAGVRLQEVLVANLYNLMGSVGVDDTGRLVGTPNLGDSRYSLFDSGWYWSVEKTNQANVRISSASLADQVITVPEDVPLDQTFQRSFEITDKTGDVLLGYEAQVFLGEGDDLYSFRITANKDVLAADIAAFTGRLAIILSAFAFSIVLATYLLVRLGLRPLSRATGRLSEIRSGAARHIDGVFPDEIQPLIDETNALIESNNTIVERARTQVGNLAHSLKTPLAVMNNELQTLGSSKRSIFSEQMDVMRQQVQVYLDRARISARSSTAIARTPLIPVLEKLVHVVKKLNPATIIETNLQTSTGLIFEGEEHDLQEIFGNLLENSAKYAEAKVVMRVDVLDRELLVSVEDDGPGMSAKDMDKAKKRGGRIDEGKTGWGLGLSIVRDIVEEYDGKFELSRSELGGLKSTITLPGRTEK